MITTTLSEALQALNAPQFKGALAGIKRGIEREALRINHNGRLAQTGHPEGAGHALTHPHITTDYSESLLEFITPVSENAEETLAQLSDLQKFTLAQMQGERLWPMSMPCFIESQDDIALAQFGSSNIGRMKTLYRQGLKSRYGSMMQAIAGVHFNMSFSDKLWQALYQLDNQQGELQSFISERYLGLIRNFKRELWLISYLFGASPALCHSFLQGRQTNLPFKHLGKGTLYLEQGTALRLGNLGYTNSAQSSLRVTYNSLCDYVKGLQTAIRSPSDIYADIPDYRASQPLQLNSNILQIENEFYSPIRPKRNTKKGETPTQALARGGIEYIEVRALDVNPFTATGISLEQIYFLDVFLTYCLLKASPEMSWDAQQWSQSNLQKVVNEGRDPQLMLTRCGGQPVAMRDWATQIFVDLTIVAEALDAAYGSTVYGETIATMAKWVAQPELTYSGRLVAKLVTEQSDSGTLALRLAEQYALQHHNDDYKVYNEQGLKEWAQQSFAKAKEIEASDTVSFTEFLTEYFAKA
ncbi:glutamate--cysteine ligase [Pseudoalteromonas fenneropenaei]|uniref:Glutamate--cysteine ligase n=1 Tax=Pseudoalteromonas fenneropenaei TaxID=1737459 RepID=A0ABV7CN23_9GAMM